MTDVTDEGKGVVLHIPLHKIVPGNNDRKYFDPDELERLARDIYENGQISPGTVRPRADGMYELVAGERRWRAMCLIAERAKWAYIFATLFGIPLIKVKPVRRLYMSAVQYVNNPDEGLLYQAVVRDLDDEAAKTIMFAENDVRQDINPIEQANGYKERMRAFNLSIERMAEIARRPVEFVKDRLALLDLCLPVQHLIRTAALPLKYAKMLRGLSDSAQINAVTYYNAKGPSERSFRIWTDKIREVQAQPMFDLFVNMPLDEQASKLGIVEDTIQTAEAARADVSNLTKANAELRVSLDRKTIELKQAQTELAKIKAALIALHGLKTAWATLAQTSQAVIQALSDPALSETQLDQRVDELCAQLDDLNPRIDTLEQEYAKLERNEQIVYH